jgi:formyltetrahydrofolate synthetase
VLVHAGPFANIAFGNSSVVADLVALPRADYVVTEAGFGADLGAEKFVHLKCLASGLSPDAVVLVATVRAVRHHDPAKGTGPAAVAAGAVNLRRHVATLRSYGVPVVVAINRFPDDTPEELAVLHEQAGAAGAVAVADHTGFADGGAGSEALAEAVEAACAGPVALRRAYAADATIPDKLDALARQVYGAGSVRWEPTALRSLERITKAGHGALPVCVAKTNLSLSHDPTLLGAPEGFVFPVRDVRLYAGAGYVTVLAGEIMTMPGLPSKPKYADIDLLPDGTVVGLV